MNFKHLRLRSLKTRLTIFTLAIFLVGIGSIAFYASHVLRRNIETTLGDQQFSTVTYAAQDINEEVEDHLSALHQFATRITPAMMANPSALQKQLEQELILKHMFNAGVLTAGLDGIIRASTPVSAKRAGINVLDREYVTAALTQDKSTVSKPILGRALKVPVIIMGVPIHNPQGKVIGVLAGVTDLSKPSFLDRITESTYGKSGGYVLLIPKERLIITATDKSRIMQPLPAIGVNPALDRWLSGYEGSAIFTNPLGSYVLGSAKRIPAAEWLLGLTLPVHEAFAPIRNMMIGLFISALLAGALIWWVLRKQLAPMSDAAKVLTSLSDKKIPLQALPIRRNDEIGELIGAFNRMLSISTQREADLNSSRAEIFESKNLLLAIIDTLPVRVFWKDTHLNYLGCNIAFAKDAGLNSPAELPGKNDFQLSWAEQAEHYRADDQTVIDYGIAKLFFEEKITTPNGAMLWLRTSKVPLRNHENKIVGVLGIYEDYTYYKVAEQDAQILRDQLAQATKMEAVGHLTAGIAHDFNNMLGAIMGYTELSKSALAAETSATSITLKRYMGEVLNASQRAKELIAQMLTFSRLQTNIDNTIAPSTLLTPVVKEVVSLLRSSIPSTIELNYQINTDDLKAFIHPVQLHQIILNLAVNARDSIVEYGKIDISLSQQHLDTTICSSCKHPFAGEYAKISVSDSGSGIETHLLNNIFNPFFTTKSVGKGTGMGLSVVHGLVHAMNGHIQIESILGKGTTFTILLPLSTTSAAHPIDDAMQLGTTEALRGLKIMLVDDDLSMNTMLQEFLSIQSAHITAFNSPIEAMRTFEHNPNAFDIVITDETMPGLSGMHLAELMLRFKPQLPIILCTGYSDHATPELAEKAGIAGFFYKPLKMNELLSKLLTLKEKV
jgi:PAS domain S-box-containing protein